MQERIDEFKKRIEVDGKEFCEELYRDTEVRLLACKYAYYVKENPFLEDNAYDHTEKSWYVMGRALDILKEDETSPCIDWDEKHPRAAEAIELANKLMKR